ncbi:MAG: 7-cyano-7-deazaguanine synthase QueC [Bacteroides sp.]|nr:7-cyano-7-deazaguanine synthase QueC [Bacteroides sp.]MBD5422542.1 7-cyano-7-deazaguanine synthase QueC [Bacteroides sp.]
MAKDTLLVLSGGMDSTTMLHEYKDTIALAVHFNYGAPQNLRESAYAAENCRRLGIELIEIPLAFMSQYFESSLLQGGDAIPSGSYDDANMRSTVVPFRNGIMLSIAAGLAESRGLRAVMIANHSGDHSIYPDCRPRFIQAMSAAIAAGTYKEIALLAPYTDLSKADIACRGAALGVDYSLTYSCYRGGPTHCGTCTTCTERRQALRAAGLTPDC